MEPLRSGLNWITPLIVLLLWSSCAPLHPHNSTLEDVGEVAGRTVLGTLTLGMSEVIFRMEYDDQQKREAYGRWYRSLSYQDQAREDQREAARLNALGTGLIGGGFRGLTPSTSVPIPVPEPPPCASYLRGPAIYTDCQ